MARSSALRYYIVTRLLLAPLMIWTITTVVFLLLRATPGDPIDALLGPRAPEAVKDSLRQQLGLDAPLIVQYLRYLRDCSRLIWALQWRVKARPSGKLLVTIFRPPWN